MAKSSSYLLEEACETGDLRKVEEIALNQARYIFHIYLIKNPISIKNVHFPDDIFLYIIPHVLEQKITIK